MEGGSNSTCGGGDDCNIAASPRTAVVLNALQQAQALFAEERCLESLGVVLLFTPLEAKIPGLVQFRGLCIEKVLSGVLSALTGGRAQEALNTLEKLVHLGIGFPGREALRGTALRMLNRATEALALLEQELSRDPGNSLAREQKDLIQKDEGGE